MGIRVGYMGTKKYVAPHVREVVSQCQPGPMLDAFGGMSAVGEALSDQRQVWVNDVQRFSCEVGRALFLSRCAPEKNLLGARFWDAYKRNEHRLLTRFRLIVSAERVALQNADVNRLKAANEYVRGRMSSDYVRREVFKLQNCPTELPYRLFALNYSGTFFSLRQTIEIDSLRFAIDTAFPSHENQESHRWCLIALGVSILRVSGSTGHFAQYLDPNERNCAFLTRQRRRSVCEVFEQELEQLSPIGSLNWRRGNRVFCGEAIELLSNKKIMRRPPAVIYADPPYTRDQYSRFYHLWETLVQYDYPPREGKGCYRPDRFQTAFAYASKVEEAFSALSAAAAATGAQLVLSYPQNGLLSKVAMTVEEIVRRHYPKCEAVSRVRHQHSTMGGANGRAKYDVTEIVYLATH